MTQLSVVHISSKTKHNENKNLTPQPFCFWFSQQHHLQVPTTSYSSTSQKLRKWGLARSQGRVLQKDRGCHRKRSVCYAPLDGSISEKDLGKCPFYPIWRNGQILSGRSGPTTNLVQCHEGLSRWWPAYWIAHRKNPESQCTHFSYHHPH